VKISDKRQSQHCLALLLSNSNK